MSKQTYYGITIGPIISTMDYTSTPGGLWNSSYVFSYITKRLMQELKEKVNILLPAEDKNSDSTKKDDVGLYPDHIIFYGDIEPGDINEIISIVKDEVSDKLANCFGFEESSKKQKAKDYFKKYFSVICVRYGELKMNQPLIEVSKVLDTVELSVPYVFTDEHDYVLDFFHGDANNYLRKFVSEFNVCPQTQQDVVDENRLPIFKNLKDIAEISGHSELKISKYFAIVYADGDNMSDSFKAMSADQEKIKEFSEACIEYTKESSKMIKQYGGVTIYAGGDDLLFIAPLLGQNNETIFELCRNIQKGFDKKIVQSKICPTATVSFGVSVSYYKFPLYEATKYARDMLFGEAKNFKYEDKEKNNIAIKLSKASGQAICLVFKNNAESFTKFCELLKTYYVLDKNKDVSLERANSVVYLMDHYTSLFDVAAQNNTIEQFFNNLYDNPNQTGFTDFIKEVSELYKLMSEDEKNHRFKYIGQDDNKVDTKYSAVLRMAKFFVEKRGQ